MTSCAVCLNTFETLYLEAEEIIYVNETYIYFVQFMYFAFYQVLASHNFVRKNSI